MKKVGAAVAVLAVLTGSGVGYYLYALKPTDETARAAASSASPAQSLLASLDDPRPLPQLQFTDAKGIAMTLADFSGKVVLLNIWATWCVPCRKEMPTLDRLQAKLGGADFAVVTVSIDRDGAAKVSEFYKEIGAEHLGIYLDGSGKVGRDLNTIGLPTTLLIDRQGRDLGRVIGPAEWDDPAIVSAIMRAIVTPPTAWNRAGLQHHRLAQRSYEQFVGPYISVKDQRIGQRLSLALLNP